MFTDNAQPDVSRSLGSGRSSRKAENSSDSDERPELRSQKSLDGEDSSSDRGSVMEETNSHLYQELLDAVLKMKDADGRMICELFLKLPPRQVSPSTISKLYVILWEVFYGLLWLPVMFHSCCNILEKTPQILEAFLVN